MELRITYEGGAKLATHVEDHIVYTDLPEKHGGDNSAPDPTSLFVTSLGACVGLYTIFFCRNNDLDAEGLEVNVKTEMADKARRVASADIKVMVPPSVPEKMEKRLQKYVEKCTVHNSLHGDMEINVGLERRG